MTVNGSRTTIPKHSIYPSKYSSLSDDKKSFYDEWMNLKNELDALLPNGATTLTNSIKIRKSGIERAASLIKHGDIKGLV